MLLLAAMAYLLCTHYLTKSINVCQARSLISKTASNPVSKNYPMPPPPSTDPPGQRTRKCISDERPMINIKFPDLLPDVPEVFNQIARLTFTVNSSQGAKWSVCVYADPFLLGHVLSLPQNLPVPLQLPPIKSGDTGNHSRH